MHHSVKNRKSEQRNTELLNCSSVYCSVTHHPKTEAYKIKNTSICSFLLSCGSEIQRGTALLCYTVSALDQQSWLEWPRCLECTVIQIAGPWRITSRMSLSMAVSGLSDFLHNTSDFTDQEVWVTSLGPA